EQIQNGSAFVKQLQSALAETARGSLSIVTETARNEPATAARDRRVPVRNRSVKGPLPPGGEWLAREARVRAARRSHHPTRLDNSDAATYEIVNFMDGEGSVSDIRDAVSAEFEPIDLKLVAEYIDLLARAGAVAFK